MLYMSWKPVACFRVEWCLVFVQPGIAFYAVGVKQIKGSFSILFVT